MSTASRGRLRVTAQALACALVLAAMPLRAGFTAPSESKPSREPLAVPNELLVRFDPGSRAADRAKVRSHHDLERIEGLPLQGLERVSYEGDRSAEDMARRVEAEGSVRYAEPNFTWQADAVIPNDPEFPELWGLDNTGQTGGTVDADIDAPEGWELASPSDGVVVGVIDTGVMVDHPDLAPNIWTNPGESGTDSLGRDRSTNGIDDDTNGYVDDVHGWDFWNGDNTVFDEEDGDDHGTHVAGTISAVRGNGVGVAGVSDAKVMALKFLGPFGGFTSDALLALDYAIRNGADLTSNSWGGGGESLALRDKIAETNAAGVLFVTAAGNFGEDIDPPFPFPVFPCSYEVPNVICVAATDDSDTLASFSNFGRATAHLAAPGESILSTVPQLGKAILVGPDTDPAVSHTSAYHTFGLEGVLDATDRTALLSAALARTGIAATEPILLVDDDARSSGARPFEATYLEALQSLGYTNVIRYSVPSASGPCADGPNAVMMIAFSAVIWFTGDNYTCTLTTADQSSLTTYLSGPSPIGQALGRHLLLFGVDIGYDLTDDRSWPNSFYDSVLRARYIADLDFNLRPIGQPDTPYSGLPVLELKEGFSGDGQSFSSPVMPRVGSVAGLRGFPTTWFSGTSMATPHVSGAVAQVLARNPGIGHLLVKSHVLSSGDPLPSLAETTISGRRLNLANALGSTPTPEADLELVMTDIPDPVSSGATLTYQITVTNGGPSPAASVELTDVVPSQLRSLTLVSQLSAGWTCSGTTRSGRTFRCSAASLPPGTTASFTLQGKVRGSTAPGAVISNPAAVSTTTADPVAANNLETESTTVF